MTTPRDFCRFVRPSEDSAKFELQQTNPSTFQIPPSGICLSVFLVLTRRGSPSQVLLGRLDPGAPWGELGALGGGLLERASRGWMIPSSHLMLFESPEAAALRVMKEQLELERVDLEGPRVFSDVYDHPLAGRNHWDIGFVFSGVIRGDEEIFSPKAWSELRFVDVTESKRSDLVRSHSDVLEFAGLRFSS